MIQLGQGNRKAGCGCHLTLPKKGGGVIWVHFRQFL